VPHRQAVPRRPGAGRRLAVLATLVPLLLPVVARAQQVDDRDVTITSPVEAAERRRALIAYVWGARGFPRDLLPTVITDVQSPLPGLTNVKRVDELRVNMGPVEGLAYHFIPLLPNGRLVIVHNGHTCAFDEAGVNETIAALLAQAYAVLTVFMPRVTPRDCAENPHDALFTEARFAPATGSPMQYFLDPVAASVNYLRSRSQIDHFPLYREIDMTGLSGGGWTTTVYAAIDPRIRVSIPVAGSIPLYSRGAASLGDMEQYLDGFYEIAGYPDLYLLGARERNRSQLWILNRKDSCCFGANPLMYRDPDGRAWDEIMRGYETDVRRELEGPSPAGSFRLLIDDTAEFHMISPFAIDAILAELARTARAPRR